MLIWWLLNNILGASAYWNAVLVSFPDTLGGRDCEMRGIRSQGENHIWACLLLNILSWNVSKDPDVDFRLKTLPPLQTGNAHGR